MLMKLYRKARREIAILEVQKFLSKNMGRPVSRKETLASIERWKMRNRK